MVQDNTRRIRRRRFIKTTGAAGVLAGLAGCSGGDGGDGGGDGGDGGGGDGGDGGGEVNFPTRDLTAVIYAPPGGGYDFYTRLLAKYLPEHLPGDFNVQPQNVTGASGRIAMQQIYGAGDDAHQFMIMNLDRFPRNQVLYDLNYNLGEFTFYPQVAREERAVGIGSHTDIRTFSELSSAIQNEELAIGTAGPTSGSTIILVVLGEVTGEWTVDHIVDNMVTYDGTGPIAQAMLAGDIDVMASSYSSMLTFFQNDQAVPLMYMTDEDSPPDELVDMNSDVQTLATAGIESANQIMNTVRSGRGFGGPPDVPDAHARIMREAITEALTENDDLLAEAEQADRPIVYGTSQDTADVVQNKISTWSELSDVLNQLVGDS